PYSDTGNAVSICAPSNGGSLAIFTTDRRGSAGYNTGSLSAGDAAGDYTNSFGGTSSSTPLVAGIAALMLSENANLTPAQIREILEKTADRIDEASGNYTTSPRWGAPYKHSPMYGHGRVNAHSAVNWVRNNGPTGPAVPATGGPTITGPGTYSRSSTKPPCFTVDASPHTHYAVEVCTDWQLLGPQDSRPARTPTNFFASWRTGTDRPAFATGSQFVLPDDAWERLRWADRLYFRVCSSSSSERWEGTRFSIRASEARQAPSITVTGVLPTTGAGTSIRGPVSYDAGTATPPTFDVDPSPNSHYAVEVCTEARLLGPQEGRPERTSSNFYASWRSGTGQPNLTNNSIFRLPAEAWGNLKSARQLYYRVITSASGSEWQQHRYSTATGDWASAPFVALTGNRSVRDEIFQPSDSAPTQLAYPSGEVFDVVAADDVPEPFAAPEGHVVPLIDIRGRRRDYLSASFMVRDFCAPSAEFVRISPSLVDGLQRLRDAIGGIRIMAGHIRSTEVTRANGAAKYLVSGLGAVIQTGRRSPLKLARAALENVRLNKIVLGLYADRLLVALQSAAGVTAYAAPGAELTTAEFRAWVDEQITAIRAGRSVTVERPSIDGPSEHVASAPPPQFMVDLLDHQWFGVEIATRPELLNARDYQDERRTSPNFYASYRRGLSHAEGSTVFAVPVAVWERLRTSPTLYYRVLTSSTEESWQNTRTSLPDDQADNAPFITVISRTEKASRIAPTAHAGEVIVDPAVAASRDEELWRR
ncbi:MAG: S8 family serine peptidase, partial [Gammaproteobacteria bacterium]|nr:S8 family serine peptidase [Gammaproteobacteria bacterium]